MTTRDYTITWIDHNGCHGSYMGHGSEQEMQRKKKQFSHFNNVELIVEGEVKPIRNNLK